MDATADQVFTEDAIASGMGLNFSEEDRQGIFRGKAQKLMRLG